MQPAWLQLQLWANIWKNNLMFQYMNMNIHFCFESWKSFVYYKFDLNHYFTRLVPPHVNHGRVLTDPTFGYFRFSPDGKYLVYMAEMEKKDQFQYQGSFYNSPKVQSPGIFLYNVEENTFWDLNKLLPGDLRGINKSKHNLDFK